ncbi:MAG: hypothetical protein LBG58_13580 [Planctomycetaceae bacterium]|nr:hypothetical protein [Planctomycetaceae bacterium]
MLRRNIFNMAIANLPLCADGNEKTGSTVATFRRKVAYLLNQAKQPISCR